MWVMIPSNSMLAFWSILSLSEARFKISPRLEGAAKWTPRPFPLGDPIPTGLFETGVDTFLTDGVFFKIDGVGTFWGSISVSLSLGYWATL